MQKYMKITLMVILFSTLIISYALSGDKIGVTYEKDVKPVFDKRCVSCHGSDAPTIDEFKRNKESFMQQKKGPRMGTYENLMTFVNGKDAGALMRRLDDGKNTKDGKPGNMYKALGGTDSERAANLELIKNWVGGWTLKRKAEIREAELKAINALER